MASIITARDADHAVALANDSEFGLTASIFTTDAAKARDIANQLETGGIFVNAFSVSKEQARHLQLRGQFRLTRGVALRIPY